MNKNDVIRKKDEFTRIIKAKKFVSENALSLYYQPKTQEINRVGITVTTKLGNAVQRNKAKRQLRAMIDEIYKWDEIFDTIIIIREKFKDYNFDDNKKCLERCYKKVKINIEGQGNRNE